MTKEEYELISKVITKTSTDTIPHFSENQADAIEYAIRVLMGHLGEAFNEYDKEYNHEDFVASIKLGRAYSDDGTESKIANDLAKEYWPENYEK